MIHGLVYYLTRLIEKLIALKWEKTTDVYKRQTKGSTLYQDDKLATTIIDGLDFMVTQKGYDGKKYHGNWWDSVSYTHLDVYKRQMQTLKRETMLFSLRKMLLILSLVTFLMARIHLLLGELTNKRRRS